MGALTGTGTLIRLALRRDRIKLPVWIAAVSAGLAANIPAVIDFYGSSLKEQLTYAATTAPSVVSRIFGGPIDGPNIGEIVLNETLLFSLILVAFMSTLAVVRHTRQNEETGRSEMIGSAVVGRHASLAAALIVMVGSNVLVAVLAALVLISNDLPSAGSLATGAAIGGVGIVFGAIAAITSQIVENARSANNLASLAIAVAFLLRAVGDGLGAITHQGTGITSAWPSWLSPIGWAQQLHGFTQQRWWTLALLVTFFAVAVVTAFILNARRDVGLGMIPARRGPARAAPSLLSPLGLAWRLQKGTLRGWVIGMIIGGLSVGAVANEFKDLFTENKQVAEILTRMIGNSGDVTDILFGTMFSLTAVAFAAYAVQALLRMLAEEANGLLEPVLATNVSRKRWMASHVGIVVIGVVVLNIVFGIVSGLTYVMTADAAWPEVSRLALASLAQTPAVLCIAGIIIALFGVLPRSSVAIGWSMIAFCVVIAQFGRILELPQWLLNVSPFTHIPLAPVDPIVFTPLALVSAVAVLFGVIGFNAFRRRDVTAS